MAYVFGGDNAIVTTSFHLSVPISSLDAMTLLDSRVKSDISYIALYEQCISLSDGSTLSFTFAILDVNLKDQGKHYPAKYPGPGEFLVWSEEEERKWEREEKLMFMHEPLLCFPFHSFLLWNSWSYSINSFLPSTIYILSSVV